MDNMAIWNQVSRTDPGHTKPVNYGARKFTAIDAMWQIQRATEVFGPIGQRWGYTTRFETLPVDCTVRWEKNGKREPSKAVLILCHLTLWWNNNIENCEYGPQCGINALVDEKGQIDEDAAKKALTDALTKALSHLGFSADVFLGLYDDNRYVQKMKRQFDGEKNSGARKAPDEANGAAADDGISASVRAIATDLREIIEPIELNKHYKKQVPLLEKMPEVERAWLLLKYGEHKAKLLAAPPPEPPPSDLTPE